MTWESYHTVVTYHIISESVYHTGKQGMSCPISFCPTFTEL